RASRIYPESYLPRPGSRSYVIHLDNWYAQSHPAEDWAETFAVWLDPRSRWRERYRTWPAFRKLTYVDTLMQDLRGEKPPVRTRRQVDATSTLSLTLREYFDEKQERLRADFPRFHEEQLRQIFPGPRSEKRERASRFIHRLRRELLTTVAAWTSDSRYRIHLTIEDMMRRCDDLGLCTSINTEQNRIALVAALIMLYMGSLRSGTARLAI
ncbi:MAG: putative zinc-binding metallopeptidase, partial [Gammaproteobacteria bacterium]|nr:putative zinc-binding metallopeptidase [Gammaproteobacteria bacterium]